MITECFSDKRVLITGHTGFKGTWLSLMLEKLNAKVYGYALAPDTSFYEEAKPNIEKSVIGSITDRDLLLETMQEIQPEIIVHLASHSTLNKSYEISDYIFDTNVMGLVNLLECVRKVESVKAVLVVTSDKCYKNLDKDETYDEESSLGAQDPYSASKACQELVTECYRRSFFENGEKNIAIATARASNVLGGGDYHLTRLLPSLTNDLIQGKTARIRKKNAVRPWQNVLDVLGGYLMLLEHMCLTDGETSKFCGPFNFGPEKDGIVTVGEIAERLLKYFPEGKVEIRDENPEEVKEAKLLKIKSDKAKMMLNWKPIYSLDDTLEMTVNYAKRKKSGEQVRDICISAIDQYLKGI